MVGTAANFLKELLDSQRVFGRFGYFFSGRKPDARIVSNGLRVFDQFSGIACLTKSAKNSALVP
jgi:hypothetical protein